MINTPQARMILFVIFTLSGFSGLIYESIWTHYLKLFLGHAAYAQSLVLAIFMGGMAVGSWLCSRWSGAWRNLFVAYALVEAVVGLLAMVFHQSFTTMIQLAYQSIIPYLGAGMGVHLFKWSLAALLILPQSILLGMTFPLMSAGFIRLFPEHPGRALAVLYFCNSLGAAIGILVSGFYLMTLIGLPGTIFLAGLINVTLAAVVWILFRQSHTVVTPPQTQTPSSSEQLTPYLRIILGVALATGLASFIYEIAWIRMLSLVLGSSTHAFELMLSAFIFGLALGGLWIRKRIHEIANPIRYLAYVQILMGILAIATLPLYNFTFNIIQIAVQVLLKVEVSYTIFNVISHAICFMIMLPATICAGITLPLMTWILLKHKVGERSIGVVYAANTIGAIVGATVALHVLLPWLGLKNTIVVGATIDILAGLGLFLWLKRSENIDVPKLFSALATAVLLLALIVVRFDVVKMASGVYRDGNIMDGKLAIIGYHKDGKTATVDFIKDPLNTYYIKTNGKTDAAVAAAEQPSSSDESTMVLLAVVPLAYKDNAKDIAVIGLGSGLTSSVLLAVPWVESVDTIEIEPAMVEAAQLFRPRVERVFSDKRSHIHIEDAKTFFSIHQKKYDLIISEPSNPWVSGVAGLFSDEFYLLVKNHIAPGGLLVQWIQLYELDITLTATIVNALQRHFEDYLIYAANGGDIIVLAKQTGQIGAANRATVMHAGLTQHLNRVEINSFEDFMLRKLGPKSLLQPLFHQITPQYNSDYFPVLDLNAARSRFLGRNSFDLINLKIDEFPVLDILTGQKNYTGVSYARSIHFKPVTFANHAVRAFSFLMTPELSLQQRGFYDLDVELLRTSQQLCISDFNEETLIRMFYYGSLTSNYLSPEQAKILWQKIKANTCFTKLSDYMQQLVLLYEAISLRNTPVMALLGESLLQQKVFEKTIIVRGIALKAAMAGNLLTGNAAKGVDLWEKYNKGIAASMSLKLLLAHCKQAQVANTAKLQPQPSAPPLIP